MADYVFNSYVDENLFSPSSFNLYNVTLALRESELSSSETGSSEQTWTYTILKEFHRYYPDTNVVIPFDLTGNAFKAYALANRNSFFPADLLGKAWIGDPIYRNGFNTVEVTTFPLPPREQRQRTSPKPPDRWELTFHFQAGYRVKPSYEDLIYGYSRDVRSIPDKLKITSPITQKVTLKYYRLNPYEQIPNLDYIDPEVEFVEPAYEGIDSNKSRLKSIDWYTQTLQVKKDKEFIYDITGIVLGTLQVETETGSSLKLAAYSEIPNRLYPTKYLLNNIVDLDELFDVWAYLYNDGFVKKYFGQARLSECYKTDKRLRFDYTGLGRNSGLVTVAISEGFNNCWNNYILPAYVDYIHRPTMGSQSSREARFYHPFFQTLPLQGENSGFGTYSDPNFRTFHKTRENYYPFNHANLIKWQLKPQIDRYSKFRGIGAIAMDSPRVIEIHKALDAQKYSQNDLEPSKPRISNLGWHINRQSEILGIKVKADGKIDKELARKQVRRVIDKTTRLDEDKVGVGSFGEGGMVVKRINNRFKGKEIVSDQCVVTYDLMQLIQEYQDQANLAHGIQESSAVEIKSGNNTARFDNQIQLLIEIFNLLTTSTEMQRSTLISSLISQGQTSEIIAGLGLPSVTKTIPITIDKKTTQLPYKGISPHRSISQEVATCTANVGIVLGQLL